VIVDLNLKGKLILVVGGGNEAEKRIKSLLNNKCQIIVLSKKFNTKISQWGKNKKIKIIKKNFENEKILTEIKPDLIITTTSDKKINKKIIDFAKIKKIIAYSSDNPEESDFTNPAIIDIEKIIQIAIFTGGRSPAMSKKIKEKSEQAIRKIITKQDIDKIKLQNILREKAKSIIPAHNARKAFLTHIMAKKSIDQLIKAGDMKKAKNEAMKIMREWNE
jgi:precorrin-2 dehydrogenase/sirohydrochlorin ferrochelatase